MEKKEISLKTIFGHLWEGVLPHRRLFWVCVAAFVVFQLIELAIPVFYKRFFDELGQSAPAEVLIGIITVIAVVNLANWLFAAIAHFSLSLTTAKIMVQLKQKSFDYLMLHSRKFFVNNFTGSLVQKVNRFAYAFEILMDNLVFNLIPIAICILGSIAVTAFLAPPIALVIAVWSLLVIAANFVFSRWKIKYDIARAAADSRTTGFLSDNIVNYISVKLFNGYRSESNNFKKISDDQAQKTITTWQLSNVANITQHFLIIIVEFAAFYYTISLWQSGQAFIGTFVLVQTYIIGISHQLWGVNRMFRGIYQAMADSKEMVEILETSHQIKDAPGAKILADAKGKIDFENIVFGFQDDRIILKDFDLSINSGEQVAIVGSSGAGKTTLTGLLLRLFEPTGGRILIDGNDIREITQESLRKNISLVPQDPVLFHRSILENIRYGRPEASDEEVIAAAQMAHCDKFVQKMPAGYQTMVGERGVKLSGGERQRVAIARAILKRAPILILDEATSSLDSKSEALIQDALDALMKDQTVIAIAHRLSTIRKMDRVVVLKGGTIIEQGSHQSLIRKRDGVYRKLWRLQSSGFIE
ncbi:MAG: ABC transporter ATP-binding protein [Candidatus Gastranaerophilales bacterium]|nr:ABC transporter ATP-binding protein [Candidatus Gastranaerophilales bacterium]